jgi:hypothetical protein
LFIYTRYRGTPPNFAGSAKTTALKHLHYFDEQQRHYTVDRLALQLERLGYRVHLEPVAATVV